MQLLLIFPGRALSHSSVSHSKHIELLIYDRISLNDGYYLEFSLFGRTKLAVNLKRKRNNNCIILLTLYLTYVMLFIFVENERKKIYMIW